MIVVAIIGLLAAMAIPSFARAREKSQATRVANDLTKFGDAFDMYAVEIGRYPADTHIVLPPGMNAYINQAKWNDCVIGGDHNWEGPSWGEGGGYNYAGISLTGTTAAESTLAAIDRILEMATSPRASFGRWIMAGTLTCWKSGRDHEGAGWEHLSAHSLWTLHPSNRISGSCGC